MKNIQKTILSACAGIAFLLSGCEMVYEVEMPAHKPRLAAQYTLSNDTTLAERFYRGLLFVGRSQEILSTEPLLPVSNAEILILDGAGNVVQEFRYDGRYSSYVEQKQLLAEPGNQYTMKVSAPGFDPLESTLVLPDEVVIEELTFTENQLKSTPDDVFGTLRLKFRDNGRQENYYHVLAFVSGANASDLTMVSEDEGHAEFAPENELRLDNSFADKAYNGQSIVLSVRVRFPRLVRAGNDAVPASVMKVFVKNITRDQYLFGKTLRGYQDTQGNPFAEPVKVYSSFRNGYGVFGGETVTTAVTSF